MYDYTKCGINCKNIGVFTEVCVMWCGGWGVCVERVITVYTSWIFYMTESLDSVAYYSAKYISYRRY